jgi:phosphoribosylaminoimidazole (AIR) synthetase
MARIGKIDQMEMLRATNMGIGIIAVVRPANVDAFVATLDTPHYKIGQIIPGEPRVSYRT